MGCAGVTRLRTTVRAGNDLIYLSGSNINYKIAGNVERLTVTGSGKVDVTGNALDNVIIGNSANNRLWGGLGNDTLTGGAGSDVFIFSSRLDNMDRITDFTHGQDDIGLHRSIFNTIGSSLEVTELKIGTQATDANGYIIYDSASGYLYYDLDGNGLGKQFAFAQVREGTVLDTTDFVIL
jgi:Ca2+-binding RTX toxin-like protein